MSRASAFLAEAGPLSFQHPDQFDDFIRERGAPLGKSLDECLAVLVDRYEREAV